MTFRLRRPKTLTPAPKTYWNGRPCACRRVLLVVGVPPDRDVPLAWWKGLEGTERKAVEVNAAGQPPFYLEDENGEGWSKVTIGKGLPNHGHRSIWPERVVRDLAPNECPPLFTIPSLEEQYMMRRAANERLMEYRSQQDRIAQWRVEHPEQDLPVPSKIPETGS